MCLHPFYYVCDSDTREGDTRSARRMRRWWDEKEGIIKKKAAAHVGKGRKWREATTLG